MNPIERYRQRPPKWLADFACVRTPRMKRLIARIAVTGTIIKSAEHLMLFYQVKSTRLIITPAASRKSNGFGGFSRLVWHNLRRYFILFSYSDSLRKS